MLMTKEANILIVEDQEINVRLLKGMLLKEGYTNVLFTSDAREALPLFEEFHPDLVLLDLHMPHLDGFEIMEQISQFTWGDYLPILVLTGDTSSHTQRRALSYGAMDFINKPFKVAEVLLRVNNFLQARLLHLQLKAENLRLQEAMSAQKHKLEAAQINLLEALAETVSQRSECGYGEFGSGKDERGDGERGESEVGKGRNSGSHSRRLAPLAGEMARRLGLSAHEASLLRRAAPLHDLGKLTIPDLILLKPGQLTDDEFQTMKAHVEAGAHLLHQGHGEMLRMAEEIALTHHEKWDGTGYPRGLEGEEIPLVGRIMAIADVFDALTHERSYKKAWPIEAARTEIVALSGHHFDPVVVEAFIAVLEDQALEEQALRNGSNAIHNDRVLKSDGALSPSAGYRSDSEMLPTVRDCPIAAIAAI